MASPTQWTWVWVNSGSWWWTGRPGVLRSMGSQRVGHDWATELNWTEPNWFWLHDLNWPIASSSWPKLWEAWQHPCLLGGSWPPCCNKAWAGLLNEEHSQREKPQGSKARDMWVKAFWVSEPSPGKCSRGNDPVEVTGSTLQQPPPAQMPGPRGLWDTINCYFKPLSFRVVCHSVTNT